MVKNKVIFEKKVDVPVEAPFSVNGVMSFVLSIFSRGFQLFIGGPL